MKTTISSVDTLNQSNKEGSFKTYKVENFSSKLHLRLSTLVFKCYNQITLKTRCRGKLKTKTPYLVRQTRRGGTTILIKVYSKPKCSKCVMLKRWLGIKGIEFTEVNIMEDEGSLSKLRDAGRLSLPVLEINEEFVDYKEFNDILSLI